MRKIRLVAVLVVREGQVVQSVRFKHTNVIHYDPIIAMDFFNKWDIDEIVILNVSRRAESKDEFLGLVEGISVKCFVPVTVGGWITDADYATKLLRCGADKLCLNTALLSNPGLVTDLALRFGTQCIVASIDVKHSAGDCRSVVVDRGRVDTGIRPIDWATQAVKLGAGEILLNSLNHDGNRGGYDLVTLQEISTVLTVPVIAFGGVSRWEHLVEGAQAGADAVAAANVFHYTEHSIRKAKRFLIDSGVPVRKL